MSTPSANSTPNIKSAAASVIGANVIIQLYVATVTGTPDIDLSSVTFNDADKHVITDLPKHQELARTNAESYINGNNSINSQMINTLADLIGFANIFESRYQRLLALAGPDGNPQGTQLTSFNEGLQGLINVIETKENNCQAIIKSLGDFSTVISGDERNLKADDIIISATLNGEEGQGGQIEQVKARISADHEAIQKDNAMIAGGAAMEVGGILMIVVGVCTEELSFGASTALVVGGLAVIGGGIAMQVLAGKDISSKMYDLSQQNVTLAEDETVAATLTLANKNVTAILSSLDSAVQAVTSLQTGWTGLKGDLQNIIDALNAGQGDEGTSWLIDDLNAAKADWDDAKQLAVQLQSNGTISVKNTTPIKYPMPVAA
jgi:non-hemolytic enterotoxin B/C